jgi:hypothetical protein
MAIVGVIVTLLAGVICILLAIARNALNKGLCGFSRPSLFDPIAFVIGVALIWTAFYNSPFSITLNTP